MRAARIKIKNIAGVEWVDFRPGKVTVISGPNAAGKSSIMRAIKAIAQGGHDATLLRAGTDKGETVIEFEDESGARVVASRKYKPGGSSLSVVGKDGELPSPQRFIRKLWDSLSANPVAFLEADEPARMKALLEALPIEKPTEELIEILGEEHEPGVDFADLGALEAIDKAHEALYAKRRETNRALKQDEATRSKLSGDLPQEEFRYNPEALAEARADKERLDSQHLEALEELRKEYEARKAAIDKEWAARREAQAAEVARLEAADKESSRIQGTREVIADLGEKINHYDQAAADLTKRLKLLESLRGRLLKQCPIRGVEVKNGQIYLNCVEWSSLSTSQQMRIAIQVAKLRAGEIGLICVDGAEAFDEKNFEGFKKLVEKSGLQAITARVTNEDRLRIETGRQMNLPQGA